jgi:acyl carrier protein
MNNIESRVKQIVAHQTGVSETAISGEQNLVKDLGMDSLDEVECLMAIEDTFDLRIEDEDAREMKTVQQLVDYVTKAKQPA